MKLKRPELLMLAATALVFFFTAGFFVGRGTASRVITVTPLTQSAPLPASPSEGGPGATADLRLPAGSTARDGTTADAGLPETAESPDSGKPSPATPPNTENALRDGAPEASDTPVSDATTVQVSSENRININTASATELCDLPGIGPVLSERIIEYRSRSGGFSSISEIKNVSGIGDAKYAAIKDLITV